MALATEQVVGLEYEHVYAHDWNPWNEMADCIAKHMSDNIGSQLTPGPPPFPTEWFENPAVPDWVWMSLLAPADKVAYPLWNADQLVLTEYPPIGDHAHVPLPFDIGTLPEAPCLADDPRIALRFASANVLTLQDEEAKKKQHQKELFTTGRVELTRLQILEGG